MRSQVRDIGDRRPNIDDLVATNHPERLDLTPAELKSVTGMLGQIATAAYKYSQGQREARAAANLGDAARAVIGMLGDKNLLG